MNEFLSTSLGKFGQVATAVVVFFGLLDESMVDLKTLLLVLSSLDQRQSFF
jgi:hypothetical protein